MTAKGPVYQRNHQALMRENRNTMGTEGESPRKWSIVQTRIKQDNARDNQKTYRGVSLFMVRVLLSSSSKSSSFMIIPHPPVRLPGVPNPADYRETLWCALP